MMSVDNVDEQFELTPIEEIIVNAKVQKARVLLFEQIQEHVKFIEEERQARHVLNWKNDREDRAVLLQMRKDSKHAAKRLSVIAMILEERFGISA